MVSMDALLLQILTEVAELLILEHSNHLCQSQLSAGNHLLLSNKSELVKNAMFLDPDLEKDAVKIAKTDQSCAVEQTI